MTLGGTFGIEFPLRPTKRWELTLRTALFELSGCRAENSHDLLLGSKWQTWRAAHV